MAHDQTHESLDRADDDAKVPSERNFGLTFFVVFCVLAMLPLLRGAHPRYWLLAIGALFLALAFAAPRTLRPLNLAWFRLGLVLHRIVNPIVLGVMFFVVITPMALVMRLAGKKFIAKGYDAEAASYWIVRDPPGPEPESVRRQF